MKKERLEIIYKNLSQNFFEKINKNQIFYNFDNSAKAQAINYEDYDGIKYPIKFKIIDLNLYDKINRNNFNGIIFLTKINYLINQGKLIIKFNLNKNNELLIGNYDIENDNFVLESIFYYYNKEGIELHFGHLSKNQYSTIKHYELINDKTFLINDERKKIGVVYNINKKKYFATNFENYNRNKNLKEDNSIGNLLSADEEKHNIRFIRDTNLTTELEYSQEKKYKEDNIYKEKGYEIEFDSYSFFTTLPIPNLTCINCNSEIELDSIKFNDKNEDDILIFNCLGECGNIDNISIKEYIKKFLLNTYLYKKCDSCEKLQLNENNIFNYCLKCYKIFCIQCYANHNHSSEYLKINDINNKCLIHKNKDLKCYCYEDKKKICENCLNVGSHLNHSKILVDEISPIKINNENLEIIIFENIMDYYKQTIDRINENKRKNLLELFENNKIKLEREYDNKKYNLKLKENEEKKKIIINYKNKEDDLGKIYNNKINNKSNEISSEISSHIGSFNNFINNSHDIKGKCNSFQNFLDNLNNIKNNYQEILFNLKKSYDKTMEDNKRIKESEIKNVEKRYSNLINENKKEQNFEIEKLREKYDEDISKIEYIKDDFLVNKYKAHIILGKTIYNAYKMHGGNILNTKNMYNLMYIYYNNNNIFNNIVLKTMDNWKIEYKEAIMRKKNHKISNFIEAKGIKGILEGFFNYFQKLS